MPNPESEVDHYKIWEVEHKPLQRSLALQDQFHKNPPPLTAQVSGIQWILNPVRKNDHKVLQPRVHLTGYTLSVEEKKQRTVDVQNQFTNGKWVRWILYSPDHLLLPASKVIGDKDPGPPPRQQVDHFLCYAVLEAPPVSAKALLEDQFDVALKKKEVITKLTAKYLAVPVIKVGHGGKILHPDAHLAIYAIAPEMTVPPIAITTRDQFSEWRISAVRSLYLAVPSSKRWEEGH